jgi:RNA polymerase sigma-70 factor (ECF subfamily)
VSDATTWIPRARAGDQLAIARLVDDHQGAVFNLCYRMLGDPGEAEDVAQETFVRMVTHLDRYDRTRAFKTWLLSIAAHACIDRLRRRRVTWLSIDEPLPAGDQPALADQAPGPEETLERREQEALIQRLLGRLAPDDRQVLVLRYWYDLGYDEIAEATGATVSAVKARLFRARRELAHVAAGVGLAEAAV